MGIRKAQESFTAGFKFLNRLLLFNNYFYGRIDEDANEYENGKKSHITSTRRWAFLHIMFSIALFYYIDGLPSTTFDGIVSNWKTKTILDIKASSTSCPVGYENAAESMHQKIG